MPDYQNRRADHHVFVVPTVVDKKVVEKQAADKFTKKGESTVIHLHAKHLNGKPQTVEFELNCMQFSHEEFGNVSYIVTPTIV